MGKKIGRPRKKGQRTRKCFHMDSTVVRRMVRTAEMLDLPQVTILELSLKRTCLP